jgi:hypothetical protein
MAGRSVFRGLLVPAVVATMATAIPVASEVLPAATATDSTALSITKTRVITYASSARIRAQLTDIATSTGVPNAALRLLARPAGSDRWSRVAAVITSASGSASVLVAPGRNTNYRWQFAGIGVHAAATSTVGTVLVRQRVAIRSPQVRDGFAYGLDITVWGRVSPSQAGHYVVLQQRDTSGAWRSIRSAVIKVQRLPNGTSGLGYVFRHAPAYADLRTHRSATSRNAAGLSSVLIIRGGFA